MGRLPPSVGTAIGGYVLAQLMSARGRRVGLVTGMVAATVGALLCVVAGAVGSMLLLLVGTIGREGRVKVACDEAEVTRLSEGVDAGGRQERGGLVDFSRLRPQITARSNGRRQHWAQVVATPRGNDVAPSVVGICRNGAGSPPFNVRRWGRCR